VSKRVMKLALGAALAAISAMPLAANGFTFSFDENGNGSINFGSGPATVTGAVVTDPSGGVVNVLEYNLGVAGVSSLTAGDVLVYEPDAATPSDLVRITDSAGDGSGSVSGPLLLFYSADSSGALADVGLPTSYSSAVSVIEDGSGAFSITSAGNTFLGQSDTPEPMTMLLMGGGLSLMGLIRRSRRSV